MRLLTTFFLLLLALSASAQAQPASDWPCIQRKVPEIAMAAVWPAEPPGAEAKAWASQAEVADLVGRLAARRTPLPEAEQLIRDFAARLGADKRLRLAQLFLGLFETLNAERGEVIAGIERYGRKQARLADKLRKDQEALARLRADPQADAAEIAGREEQLLWDTRIFDERRKSLTFVCEVPVLIEQRLFDLARAIQTAMQ